MNRDTICPYRRLFCHVMFITSSLKKRVVFDSKFISSQRSFAIFCQLEGKLRHNALQHHLSEGWDDETFI